MNTLTFYDAAYPPAIPPLADGVAFYIGGDAVHTWTRAEIEASPARYRLPVFVRSDPAAAFPGADCAQALAALKAIGAPAGCLVAWDTETAADPPYMRIVYMQLHLAGYELIDYGSQSDVIANDNPDGYYWGADWTGTAHLASGDGGTQYESGQDFDLDVFRAGLPFWDSKTGGVTVTAPDTSWEDIMEELPTIAPGAAGENVRTIQGLCGARHVAVAVDGSFGPETTAAVKEIQNANHITVDGIVGPQTWPALLGIS
jgi:hypothetical protein